MILVVNSKVVYWFQFLTMIVIFGLSVHHLMITAHWYYASLSLLAAIVGYDAYIGLSVEYDSAG